MNTSQLQIGIAAGLLVIPMLSQVSDARPQYPKEFYALYEKEFAGNSEAKRCVVCHDRDQNKKLRNVYGKAFAESLDAKNEKDTERIIDALRKTEDKPSDVPGKTFGDLIREGKLPASK